MSGPGVQEGMPSAAPDQRPLYPPAAGAGSPFAPPGGSSRETTGTRQINQILDKEAKEGREPVRDVEGRTAAKEHQPKGKKVK